MDRKIYETCQQRAVVEEDGSIETKLFAKLYGYEEYESIIPQSVEEACVFIDEIDETYGINRRYVNTIAIDGVEYHSIRRNPFPSFLGSETVDIPCYCFVNVEPNILCIKMEYYIQFEFFPDASGFKELFQNLNIYDDV
jgi:hypothetical protein